MKIKAHSYRLISWSLIAATIALMAIDGLLFLLFFDQIVSFTLYIFAHFTASALSWTAAYFAYSLQLEIKFHLLNAILLTFFGPFSSFIALSTLLFFLIYREISPSIEQLLKELNPDVSRTKSELCYQSIQTNGSFSSATEGSAPLNYYDIVELGTVKQKQQAVAKILGHFQPGFSPILSALINDNSSSIRVLAATAINAIDQKYSEMISLQEKVVAENPSSLSDQKSLALLFHSYLDLNILDEDREKKYEEQTLSILEKLQKKLPDDLDLAYSAAVRYQKRGEYKRGYEILAQFTDRGESLPPPVKLLSLELAFEWMAVDDWLKVLRKLATTDDSKESHKKSNIEIEIEEMKDLWLAPKINSHSSNEGNNYG